jgi:hypothetical protein
MRFFKRGETVDTRFIFIEPSTGEPIDVLSPTYKITHYNGPIEVVDVQPTSLVQYHTPNVVGQYVATWIIPNTAQENETYYVTGTGISPLDRSSVMAEDFFRVLSQNYFGGGSGGNGGMNIKFTKA